LAMLSRGRRAAGLLLGPRQSAAPENAEPDEDVIRRRRGCTQVSERAENGRTTEKSVVARKTDVAGLPTYLVSET